MRNTIDISSFRASYAMFSPRAVKVSDERPLKADGCQIIDASADGDHSVLSCFKDGTLYVFPAEKGQKIRAGFGTFPKFMKEEDVTVPKVHGYFPHGRVISNSLLEEVSLDGLDMSMLTELTSRFQYCTRLRELDLSACCLDELRCISYMTSDCHSLERISLPPMPNLEDAAFMFSGCFSLRQDKIEGIDFDRFPALAFFGYPLLEKLPSGWREWFPEIQAGDIGRVPAVATLREYGALAKDRLPTYMMNGIQEIWAALVEDTISEKTRRKRPDEKDPGAFDYYQDCSHYDQLDDEYISIIVEKMEQLDMGSIMKALEIGVPAKDILI